MTKRTLAIMLAVALILAAAGCGAANNAQEEPQTAEETATPADAAPSEDKAEETPAAEEPSDTESEPEESPAPSGETDAVVPGASDIALSDASAENTELTSGSADVTIGNKQISLSGAYVVDGIDAVIEGGTYSSTESDQNVFLVINGGSLTLTGAELTKTGDAGANDSTRTSDVSDEYNFYGINSVVLVVGEGSSAHISDCVITSDCSGANAVFATASASVTVENVSISTTGNSSRGVYATYGGVIDADRVTIETVGAHCAPVATDRGGGYVTVSNSELSCSGDGSPCIYSTGEITVLNVVGVSTGAQAAVIEGKNSITMTDCIFAVSGDGSNGIMLYQSMSGDADDKDATASVSTLTVTGTTIEVTNGGPLIFVTNTNTVVNLCGGNALTADSGQFVLAAAGRWGRDGSNGGTLTLNVTGDQISDSIEADDISSVTVSLGEGAAFTGDTSGSVTVQ